MYPLPPKKVIVLYPFYVVRLLHIDNLFTLHCIVCMYRILEAML